jgi:hypothetical protein
VDAAARQEHWRKSSFNIHPNTSLLTTIKQDAAAVVHMAKEGIDVSDPDHPIYPDVSSFIVNDVVAGLAYNTRLFRFDPDSPDMLKSTSKSAGDQGDRVAQAHHTFVQRLRELLGRGMSVLVRGWEPDERLTWNVESVETFKGSADQMIEYQGEIP